MVGASSATEGDDFETYARTKVEFSGGDSQETVSIPIINDNFVEEDEILLLKFTASAVPCNDVSPVVRTLDFSALPGTTVPRAEATLVIQNDDSKRFFIRVCYLYL